MVSLATDIDDRVAAAEGHPRVGRSEAKKQMGSIRALPTDFPSLGAPWLLSGLASLYGRAQAGRRLPPLANVLISNVPGPQFPLYLAGAKLLNYYPVSIPAHGVALNITVQSYNGPLEFGLIACRRAVPDVGDLADYVVEEHRGAARAGARHAGRRLLYRRRARRQRPRQPHRRRRRHRPLQ